MKLHAYDPVGTGNLHRVRVHMMRFEYKLSESIDIRGSNRGHSVIYEAIQAWAHNVFSDLKNGRRKLRLKNHKGDLMEVDGSSVNAVGDVLRMVVGAEIILEDNVLNI